MSNYSAQVREEQRMVDRAYSRLDELRAQTRERLDAVRAAGAHGSPTQRSERDSFATMYEDRLMQLRAVEDRLVFGRIDDNEGVQHHIGRIGLSSSTHEPLVTDWRAEAARPFYEATPRHHGNIAMRRHITLSFRDVVGIEDEILDVNSSQVSQASDSGTLTGEGALMASLSSRRTGKMTDIVATIQGEQDRIIRAPLSRPLVVQGGPGTGKTAVALHRAAYLLYTYRRNLQRSGVLVVGPSPAFLHYIDQVLPSLGETGVVSRTIGDLLPNINAVAIDSPRAAALKGQRRMASAIANAVAARARIPHDLPVINVNGIKVPMLAADIELAQSDARRSRKPHNSARVTFVKSMISQMVRHYINQLDYEPEPQEIDNARATLRMSEKVRYTLNAAWLPMTAQWLLSDMFSKPHKLRSYAPWLSDDEIDTLIREKNAPITISDIPLLDEAMELLGPDPREAARQASANRSRQREQQYARDALASSGVDPSMVSADMLLDSMNGGDDESLSQRAGQDREWVYGHIVVDEAQELTEMDWRMLVHRCPSRSFTIVGDVAQTSALGGARSWQRRLDKIFGHDGWDLNELTVDYRNPKAVSDLASSFAHSENLYVSTVSAVRNIADAVKRVQCDNDRLLATITEEALSAIHRHVARDGSGRITIICDSSMRDTVDKALRLALRNDASLPEEEFIRLTSQPHWDAQVSVCTPSEVKGLEYDAVVLTEPGLIMQNAASRQVAASDLYVAMTRPTQKLIIVQTTQDHNLISL